MAVRVRNSEVKISGGGLETNWESWRGGRRLGDRDRLSGGVRDRWRREHICRKVSMRLSGKRRRQRESGEIGGASRREGQ